MTKLLRHFRTCQESARGGQGALAYTARLGWATYAGLMLFFPSSAFAGGGPDTSTPVSGGNESVVTTPQVVQNNNTPVVVQQNTANGLGGTVTQISPIAPLQSSSFYSNTTQFSTNGVANNCGLSIGIGANNSNSALETIYSADIRYSTNPCPNYTKLEKIKQEAETLRVKTYVQGNIVRDCANFRTQLIQAGKNPDGACKIPDLSQMESLLH